MTVRGQLLGMVEPVYRKSIIPTHGPATAAVDRTGNESLHTKAAIRPKKCRAK